MTLGSASSGATVAHASATPPRSVGRPLSRRYFKASDRAERRRAERSSVSWKKRCTSGRSSLRGRARARSSVPSECVVGTSSKRRPLGSLTQAGGGERHAGGARVKVRMREAGGRAVDVPAFGEHLSHVRVHVPAATDEEPRRKARVLEQSRLSGDTFAKPRATRRRSSRASAAEVRVVTERPVTCGHPCTLAPGLLVLARRGVWGTDNRRDAEPTRLPRLKAPKGCPHPVVQRPLHVARDNAETLADGVQRIRRHRNKLALPRGRATLNRPRRALVTSSDARWVLSKAGLGWRGAGSRRGGWELPSGPHRRAYTYVNLEIAPSRPRALKGDAHDLSFPPGGFSS
jgi:hypothetical protein